VVILRHRDRRTVLSWSLAAGLALLALTPIFRLGVLERHEQLSWVPPLGVGSVWNFPGLVVGSVPGGWLLLGLAAFALWRPIRHLDEIVVLALAPMAVVAAVSMLIAPYWVPRYLLVVLAPLALLAAVGLLQPAPAPAPTPTPTPALTEPAAGAGRRDRRLLVLRVATVLALLAFAVHPAERAVRSADAKSGSDYRTAAAIIRQEQQPGDAIAYPAVSRGMRSGLDYYLRHDPERPRDVLLARSAAAIGRLMAQEYRPTPARLGGVVRLWLVVAGTFEDPLTVRPGLRPIVQAHYRLARIWFLHHETLALYVRLGPATPVLPVVSTR
jgi:mannosyltransferase